MRSCSVAFVKGGVVDKMRTAGAFFSTTTPAEAGILAAWGTVANDAIGGAAIADKTGIGMKCCAKFITEGVRRANENAEAA
jgi:hypothetical protein